MRKDELRKMIGEILDVPQKAIIGDENKDIEINLGLFLINKGYIRGVEERKKDWGFVYQSKTRKIAISKKKMPFKKWEKCIFRMGVNRKTGEDIFPKIGKETRKYRFLHEASHAYQDYLCSNECKKDPSLWYEKSLNGEIVSSYSDLFNFCFKRREEVGNADKGKIRGLSVWGNVSKYEYGEGEDIINKASEIAVRAQEDANELVTMFLWHPEYFNIYMDYLSLNKKNSQIQKENINIDNLEKRGLIRISKKEGEYLERVVSSYVKEMREEIKKEEN